MQIEFFPYDFEYKVEKGKSYIYLYSKQKNGEKICVIQEYQPYFFAAVEKVDLAGFEERLKNLSVEPAKVISWKEVKKNLLGKEKKFWKIVVNYPKAVPLIAKELESWDIECYERDILFVHRYLRDMNITPMTLSKAEGKFIEKTVFQAEKVSSVSSETVDWNILAVDIETYAEKKEIDPEKNPILMIAFYGKEFKKVITWKEFPHNLDYLEVVKDEKSMIKRFVEIIKEVQPDVLTGYFSDGFDLPYIKTRATKYRINLDLGLDGSSLIVNTQAGFRQSVCKISGILHLDVLKFVKNIFGGNLKTDSYSLNAVSTELLGNKKQDVNLDQLAPAWNNHPEKLAEFVEYNLHDARLTFQLCQHLMYDMTEFTKIIGLPTFDVIRMRFSRLVENYIMTRAMEYNVIAPNKPGSFEIEQRRRESIKGGFVFEPTPGLYDDIVVFDFRSLYPTIITSHNLGPEALNCKCCKEKAKVPGMKKQWFCIKEKKFMPSVLEALINRRLELKKEIKELKKENKTHDARSYALKILANAFYGYLGFFGARWYSIESAGATTAYARDYIKNTIAQARKKKFEVVYADTDSCFLLLGDKKTEEAMNFMNEINKNLPGNMELEYEGHFKKGIFVPVKGSNRGAKKKYALLGEDGKLKITGFETVRRNWSPLAKEVQQKTLQLVLTNKVEEALLHLREMVKQLRSGKIDLNKLILKTQITKELSKYSSIGPHVKVAQDLAAKGEKISPGKVVHYVIVKGTGLIREKARIPEEVSEYDTDYYLNHQLIPAVSSIFSVLGYSEDELFKKSSQTGLGKFF